jgi:hypothetical protein
MDMEGKRPVEVVRSGHVQQRVGVLLPGVCSPHPSLLCSSCVCVRESARAYTQSESARTSERLRRREGASSWGGENVAARVREKQRGGGGGEERGEGGGVG